jgi:hypothetical protein
MVNNKGNISFESKTENGKPHYFMSPEERGCFCRQCCDTDINTSKWKGRTCAPPQLLFINITTSSLANDSF